MKGYSHTITIPLKPVKVVFEGPSGTKDLGEIWVLDEEAFKKEKEQGGKDHE